MGDTHNIVDNIINTLKLNIMMGYNSTNNKGNSLYITIICIILLPLLSAFINNYNKNSSHFTKDLILSYLFKQNRILIEGKQCFKSNDFSTRNEILFGHNFKAIFNYIHNNLHNIKIYSIKEYTNETGIYDDNHCNKIENEISNYNPLYIINQNRSFLIKDNIYCRVVIDKENFDSSNSKTLIQIENIKIILFSYKKSLLNIQTFIDKITMEYMSTLQNSRFNKLFIYTYQGQKQGEDDYSRNRHRNINNYSRWSECEFCSTRTFNTLFFDEKEKLIEKIDFFEENPIWYERVGCPHTLGIGLSGPPGTGKTSVIKSIANKLKRHLIVIPLQKIKTINDLTACFFEKKYNENNKDNSITFDKKIIVFEDIDCMTDIVQQRKSDSPLIKKDYEIIENNTSSELDTKDIISAVVKGMQDDDVSIISKLNNKCEDKICLSDILNLIDGIRETPGRILIITSNYYNNLDKALIRPGRIDITLNMQNASRQTISNMYKYLYDKEFPKDKLELCKENFISPAELFNIRLNSNNSNDFIKNLLSLMHKEVAR